MYIYRRGGATSRRREAGEADLRGTETCFSFFPCFILTKLLYFSDPVL